MADAKERIIRAVKSIPKGRVASYSDIAEAAKTSPRAVGAVMRANRDPSVPCHRVVCSNGMLGGFNRGAETKAMLLRCEGIVIKNNKIRKSFFIG